MMTVLARAAVVLATLCACGCAQHRSGETASKPSKEQVMANESTAESAIVELERRALEEFGRGEIDGPLALCDEDITYFDPYAKRRIDGREALARIYEQARGKPQYARFDLVDISVQVVGDTGILSYVLETNGGIDAASSGTRWKVTAVYYHFENGWRVAHSHFALFGGSTSRDLQPSSPPVDLGRLEDPLLSELLGLEDAAMERWRRGDPWGFWELSAPGITYFDPETTGRVDGIQAMRELYAAVEGKVQYDVSEYIDPRVQAFGDIAVLSYQYRSALRLDDGSSGSGTLWNTTEVFARVHGRWRLVHTHWSYAQAGTT